MTQKQSSLLPAPFLRKIWLDKTTSFDPAVYPFSIKAIAAEEFCLEFTQPVTILVGVNGSGKSTILEAIAALCGFGRFGGNRNYIMRDDGLEVLGKHLCGSWRPKVTSGFYTRAETFGDLIGMVDSVGRWSGGPLGERSHGEAYLEVFGKRIKGQGIFLFDEPEAALSPSRQLEFLKLIHGAETTGNAQFIIATHSPLLMAYPGATVLHLTDRGIIERPFQTTEHFTILREFYRDPTGFIEGIFAD